MTKFPAVFVNHGGGPLSLVGKQDNLVEHMRNRNDAIFLVKKPRAIVVISAHAWESKSH